MQIFVIDVAGGDDIPRKGGPGIARADLLVINKTDLAPYVGSDVARMVREASERRGDLPVAAISLRTDGPHQVADWVRGAARRVPRARPPALLAWRECPITTTITSTESRVHDAAARRADRAARAGAGADHAAALAGRAARGRP